MYIYDKNTNRIIHYANEDDEDFFDVFNKESSREFFSNKDVSKKYFNSKINIKEFYKNVNIHHFKRDKYF